MSGSAGILIRRNWRQVFMVLALLTDTLALWSAAFAAHWLRLRFGPAVTLTSEAFLNVVLVSWCVFVFFVSVFGLYRAAYHVPTRLQHSIGIRGYFFTIPIVLSVLYLFHWDTFPRGFVFIFFLLLPLTFLTGRTLLSNLSTLLQRSGYGVFNALLVEFKGSAEGIVDACAKLTQPGFFIKGIGETGRRPRGRGKSVAGVPRYPFHRLKEIVEREEINRVLVPSIDAAAEHPEVLEMCRTLNIDLKVLSPGFEGLWRYSFVHDIAGIPLFVRRRRKIEWFKKCAKRVFDLVGSAVALIAAAPILFAAAVAIVAEDGFPVYFRQKRALALGKSEFEMLKFRSMKKNTEHFHGELLKRNKTSGGLLFVENDPRITRVGKFLRKFSIDELPQLFKVLKGTMSLVGPRPLSIKDIENITPENALRGFYELRSNAKPGMTGLWQISGRREVDFKDMVLLDLYYIENQSVMFDLEILFGTVPVVLFGKGAY